MIDIKNEPIYLSIVSQYKKYIDMGIYKYNDKLPSVRMLAEEMGINPNTVQRSYKVLEDDGYIKTIFKKGIYVAKDNLAVDNTNKEEASVTKSILSYKEAGIKKEVIMKIIEEVYND